MVSQQFTKQDNPTAVLGEIEKICSQINLLLDSLNETVLNERPSENSWSAAQVADHITRSAASITHALQMEAQPSIRPNLQRREELAATFLNMNHKFKSPGFILPTQDFYNKKELLDKMNNTYRHLADVAEEIDLDGIIKHPAFGDITKFELLYFVLYHTNRHLNQIKNITVEVAKKT